MNTLNINDIPTITKVNTCWRPKKAQPNPEGKGEAEKKTMPNPEGKGEASKMGCVRVAHSIVLIIVSPNGVLLSNCNDYNIII